MSLSKILKKIASFENIFCVYRNVKSVKRCNKYLIYAHVLIEIILTIINQSFLLVRKLYYDDGLHRESKSHSVMQFFLCISNSIIIITSAIMKSQYYLRFIKYVEDVELCCVNVYELKPFRRKIYCITVFHIVSCGLAVVLKLLPMVCFFSDVSLAVMFLCVLLNTYVEMRCFLENVVCTSSIVAVSAYLHCIASSMLEVQEYLNYVLSHRQDCKYKKSLDQFYAIYKKKVAIWFRLYDNIDKINYVSKKVYALQIFVILCFAEMCVGLMFYQFATTYFVRTYFEINEWPMAVLIVDSIGLIILLSEGQKVTGTILTLRRYIARIHHSLLKIDNVPNDILKPTAHLYRSMSTDSMSVVVSFSVQIGMSLLPQLIGFATEYVIIALQANSVI